MVESGRPENMASKAAFKKLRDQLEMTCEYGLYLLEDLLNVMKQFNSPDVDLELYTKKHIKNLL